MDRTPPEPALPTTAPTTPPTTAAAVVVFDDPVLEKGIRAALDKPEGDVTLTEAAALTELKLDVPWQSPEDMRIKDISALKHFVNLTNLELSFHAIKDVSSLAGLAHLTGLSLGGNNISDIAPLAGLTELDFLTLFNCQATDYSPLENLARLRTLFIEYSTIRDLSVLAGLTKLKRLQLSENAITDFSPLKRHLSQLDGEGLRAELAVAGESALERGQRSYRDAGPHAGSRGCRYPYSWRNGEHHPHPAPGVGFAQSLNGGEQ
jgi:hypothetical protein